MLGIWRCIMLEINLFFHHVRDIDLKNQVAESQPRGCFNKRELWMLGVCVKQLFVWHISVAHIFISNTSSYSSNTKAKIQEGRKKDEKRWEIFKIIYSIHNGYLNSLFSHDMNISISIYLISSKGLLGEKFQSRVSSGHYYAWARKV